MSQVELFISHSEADEALVRPLVNWLQSGLGLADHQLRCTVVTNMAVGALPAQVLRDDLLSAKAVISLITANSLRSHWVQLEMGAGWLQDHLHPIRGPGVHPSDLPQPLAGFTTVGYCEVGGMHQLLLKLAGMLGVNVHHNAEQTLSDIVRSAQARLLEDRVRWFSLPPVLSAWRLDRERYDYEFRSLCTALNLQPAELRACVNPTGVLTRDPEQVPIWSLALWNLSKSVVNHLLSPPSNAELFDVPPRVLSDELVAKMTRALSSKKRQAPRIRRWFEDSCEWIKVTPPDDRAGHAGAAQHA